MQQPRRIHLRGGKNRAAIQVSVNHLSEDHVRVPTSASDLFNHRTQRIVAVSVDRDGEGLVHIYKFSRRRC